MNNTTVNDEVEIDLQRLLGTLLRKAWLIGLVAVVCAVAVFLGTWFFVTPQYESRAKFYVNNSSLSALSNMDLGTSITTGDISASRGLVKTYIVILNTRETLNDVIDYAGVQRTYGQVRSMISAEAVDSTEIFEVVVTSPDPEEAEKIANAIAYILPNRIKNIIDGTSAKVVEAAVVPSAPSSPSYSRNAVIGFLLGGVLMAAILIIWDLMDITIRVEEDLAQSCRHPVLASVPDMELRSKDGYYYGYGKKKKAYVKPNPKDGKPVQLVGADISFAAAESYKVLRTKLQFSFAGEGACRVVGISSALTAEGKSITSVNLAYALSQLGKRVLLIDCDMRRPTVAEKLPVKKNPGLSDFLTGQSHGESLIQPCGIREDERAFHVVSSGRLPPNPMELLSSARMEKMITRLRGEYDYILLDLPPVGEVGDALAVSKLTDGMLLVVRQNYCDRISLNYAASQLEFVDAKILGTVFNCTSDNGGSYGGKYYRKYYRRYYKRYYNRYYKRSGAYGAPPKQDEA